MTLRTDATYGLKIRPGDEIHRGQYIGANREDAATSPVSGTVKSIHFDADNHEFIIVVLPAG